MSFQNLTSKKAQIEFIRDRLSNDERWILHGLVTIYKYQTSHEQNVGTTVEHNDVGFNGVDGEILTSFAEQVIRRGFTKYLYNAKIRDYLSYKQEKILRNKIVKYARQLTKIANGDV